MKKVILGLMMSMVIISCNNEDTKNDTTKDKLQTVQKETRSTSTNDKNSIDVLVKKVEDSYPKFIGKIEMIPQISSDQDLKTALESSRLFIEHNKENKFKLITAVQEFIDKNEPMNSGDIRYFTYMPLTDISRGNVAEFGGQSRMMSLGDYQNNFLDNMVLFHELVHVMQDSAARATIRNDEDFAAYQAQTQNASINQEVDAYHYELTLMLRYLESKGITQKAFLQIPVEKLSGLLEARPDQKALVNAIYQITVEMLKHNLENVDERMQYITYLAKIYAANSNQPVHFINEKTNKLVTLELQKK